MFVFSSISSAGVQIEIRIKQTKVRTLPTSTLPEDVRRVQGFLDTIDATSKNVIKSVDH